MKGTVFHKTGDISVDTVDDPEIEQDEDVILKITALTLCGFAETLMQSSISLQNI